MNKISLILLAIFSALVLSACGTGHSDSHSHGSHGGTHTHSGGGSSLDSKPYILAFDIIDSYGVDTAFFNDLFSHLNPYIDGGYFEISWLVDSRHDYIAEYYVNDAPHLFGSRLLNSDLCGPGLSCDTTGLQHCEYTSDLYLSCDTFDSNVTDYIDIAPMVFSLPEELYLVLRVCNEFLMQCDTYSRPIVVE